MCRVGAIPAPCPCRSARRGSVAGVTDAAAMPAGHRPKGGKPQGRRGAQGAPAHATAAGLHFALGGTRRRMLARSLLGMKKGCQGQAVISGLATVRSRQAPRRQEAAWETLLSANALYKACYDSETSPSPRLRGGGSEAAQKSLRTCHLRDFTFSSPLHRRRHVGCKRVAVICNTRTLLPTRLRQDGYCVSDFTTWGLPPDRTKCRPAGNDLDRAARGRCCERRG
jgi:hypothetical protein